MMSLDICQPIKRIDKYVCLITRYHCKDSMVISVHYK